jgi:hypothetical protein
VDKVEVSVRQTRHTVAGLLAGVAGGLLLAGAALGASYSSEGPFDVPSDSDVALTYIVFGGSVITGTLIGHSIQTDRWEEIPINAPMGLLGTHENLPLAYSIHFSF